MFLTAARPLFLDTRRSQEIFAKVKKKISRILMALFHSHGAELKLSQGSTNNPQEQPQVSTNGEVKEGVNRVLMGVSLASWHKSWVKLLPAS